MKRFFALLLLCVAFTTASAQWKPAGDNLKTEWGENLDPNNVLPEYPRPIMEREKWQNLNGLWPPGPAVPGVLQARTLEWVAMSSSNA